MRGEIPPVCNAHEEAKKVFATKYGEKTAEFGVTANGALIEVLINPEKDTWTILSTRDGVSCLIAAGEGWKSLPKGDPL